MRAFCICVLLPLAEASGRSPPSRSLQGPVLPNLERLNKNTGVQRGALPSLEREGNGPVGMTFVLGQRDPYNCKRDCNQNGGVCTGAALLQVEESAPAPKPGIGGMGGMGGMGVRIPSPPPRNLLSATCMPADAWNFPNALGCARPAKTWTKHGSRFGTQVPGMHGVVRSQRPPWLWLNIIV